MTAVFVDFEKYLLYWREPSNLSHSTEIFLNHAGYEVVPVNSNSFTCLNVSKFFRLGFRKPLATPSRIIDGKAWRIDYFKNIMRTS